jgi:hypothetical protein
VDFLAGGSIQCDHAEGGACGGLVSSVEADMIEHLVGKCIA